MLAPRTVLGFLFPDSARRLVHLLLLWALVPLGEIVLLVYLGGIVGTYLVFAATAATALLGALIALAQMRGEIVELRRRVRSGEAPGSEIASIAGLLVGTLLLLSPGFLTDIAGFVVLSPTVRRRLGAALVERLGIDAGEIYEYLKLAELGSGSAPAGTR